MVAPCVQIISETRVAWELLIAGESDPGKLAIGSVTVPNAIHKVSKTEAVREVEAQSGIGDPVELKSEGEGFYDFFDWNYWSHKGRIGDPDRFDRIGDLVEMETGGEGF